MRLSNSDNDFLELEILGYQFPELVDDEWDSNWLNIVGRASLGGQDWNFHDPCLCTFEVLTLIKWMLSKSKGEKVSDHISFTEPNLEMNCLSNDIIRVSFALEARPEWARGGTKEDEELFIDIADDANQLKAAAESLMVQLARYPVRQQSLSIS